MKQVKGIKKKQCLHGSHPTGEDNSEESFAAFDLKQAYVPKEIKNTSVCIYADIDDALTQMID